MHGLKLVAQALQKSLVNETLKFIRGNLMTIESIQNICETRMLVGYLGEKQQATWWGSKHL